MAMTMKLTHDRGAGSLRGLGYLAVYLRVDPEVVQRAGHDGQHDGAELGAVDLAVAGEVVALVRGERTDDQPEHEDYRADSHCSPTRGTGPPEVGRTCDGR